jgi:large conductance mechanosensitive channel
VLIGTILGCQRFGPMLDGFKKFLMRGNVLDLAVGIVMGAAFTGIVNGLLEGIVTPLIAAIFGQPDISYIGNFTINGAYFSIGTFLQAILNFLMIGAGLYFLIIRPLTRLQERILPKKPEPDPEPTEEVTLLTEIRDLMRADTQPLP